MPSGEPEGLGPAAVLVILLLGAALSVLLWQNFRRQRDAEVERQAQSYADTLSEVVSTEVAGLLAALARPARWVDVGSASPSEAAANPERWRVAAALSLKENPAVLALFAEPGWEIVGSPEGKGILRDVLPEARRRLADADGEFVTAPIPLPDGRRVLGAQVRVSQDGKDKRTVLAVIEPGIALKQVLNERGLGYAISVEADDQELYRRSSSDPKRELRHLGRTVSVKVPGGTPWALSVWPTSELGGLLDLPSYWVLIPGLLGSALVAAAVHFGTLSWRRESALRSANQRLSQQIDDTRKGEGALKRLSEELEERVEQRTAELHETIVELETFNYSVSHDLRSPLGAVINFAAILNEDCGGQLDPIGKEHLQRIVSSASSAVSMMDALLAYSRSGRTELHRTDLAMRPLVEDVCDELAAGSPQLKCAVQIGDLPDACADENMVRVVFSNLIGNACKFTRSSEAPRVEVGGGQDGDEVIYFVRDEGIGFDMRFAQKLFKVFERLHASPDYPGHGVGLAIVARLVRRHGGRVWAQGAVDKGATFYFALPIEGEDDGRSTS